MSQELGELVAQKKELVAKIETMKEKTTYASAYYSSLANSVATELSSTKEEAGENWRNIYPKIATRNGCKIRISFNGLVECVAQKRFESAKATTLAKIDKLNESLLSLNAKIEVEQAKEQTSKAYAQQNNTSIVESEKKYKAIKAKAKAQTSTFAPIIYLIVWGWGLYIELLVMMWGELIAFLVQKKEKKEVLEEVEKTITTASTPLNIEGKKFALDFAHPDGLLQFKELFISRNELFISRNKRLAVTNSIVGAFLYAYTIKKHGNYINSWKQLSVRNILYVNGRLDKKKEVISIESYIADSGEQITCLGSTARKLKSKEILAYLKREGSTKKHIAPQREAIDYLISLEEQDKRFLPQSITEEEIKRVIYAFVAKFHNI